MAFKNDDRVRVANAHNLRGKVVSLRDGGNIADVQFDQSVSGWKAHPYHVAELELESAPCPCAYCARPR